MVLYRDNAHVSSQVGVSSQFCRILGFGWMSCIMVFLDTGRGILSRCLIGQWPDEKYLTMLFYKVSVTGKLSCHVILRGIS